MTLLSKTPARSSLGAASHAALVMLLATACTGTLGSEQAGPGEGPGANGDGTPAGSGGAGSKPTAVVDGTMCTLGASFAPARVSLLTDAQYVHIVHDVFGVSFQGDVTTAPSTSGQYAFDELAQVSTNTMQAYLQAADQVAAGLTPCGSDDVTAACFESFLRDKLPHAWRRPVTDDEVAGLMTVFQGGLADGAPRAVQLAMEAALGAAPFLYRTELGADATGAAGTSVTLTPYELASAVSFALLDSIPDAELTAKAADGSLARPEVLAAEVDRLLALPAVHDALQKKVSYYLDFEKVPLVTKDLATYPDFVALRDTVYASSQKFLDEVMWGGTFSDLFTSRRVYANEAMAKAYGLPAVTGEQLVAVETTGDAYDGGLLTQPALLLASNQHANSDDIVHRGLWVYTNLLCGVSIGPPPAGATSVFNTLTGSEREKALKRDAMSCGGCHASFDPFGLMTEGYDPIGRYRATDPATGQAYDESSTVVGLGDELNGPLGGPHDLASKLAHDPRASDCAAAALAKYTLAHNPDVEGSCEMVKVKSDFAQHGSFPALFRAVLTSSAFLTRDL